MIDVQKQKEKRIDIQGIMAVPNQFFGIKHGKGAWKCLSFMAPKETVKLEFGVGCSKGKLMVFVVVTNRNYQERQSGVVGSNVTSKIFDRNYQESWSGFAGHTMARQNFPQVPVQLRQLLISNCFLFQGFPKSIGHLKHLKKIIIIQGLISSLPDEFCLLQSLEHLVLRYCHNLSSLPNSFGNLSNLQHLCLSGCSQLRRLPVSFKNLILLEHLSLQLCSQLTFMSEEDLNFLENITKLQYLDVSYCTQLKALPPHVTNQVSLRVLDFSYNGLRELPEDIGRLSRLTEMKIEHVPPLASLPTSLGDMSSLTRLSINLCYKLKLLPDTIGDLSSLVSLSIFCCPELKCLPDTLGGLSSLTFLEISRCAKLKCLPDSIGDLSSLISLSISDCPKLQSEGVKSLPKSIRQLNNLQALAIQECPIGELDFGLSKLKVIYLDQTEVCRISFPEDCFPHLESLHVKDNHLLKEIEALPARTLNSIFLENCEMLKSIPSFAGFTSLREFVLSGCYGIEKVEGLENCTSLQKLTAETCWEEPGIESLEDMQNLKWLHLKTNKGTVIERCIQRIQKWPDERMVICARTVPVAASLVDSLLSPDLVTVDFFSNKNIYDRLNVKPMTPSGGGALMFCIVINCVSSEIVIKINEFEVKVEKGRWSLVGVGIEWIEMSGVNQTQEMEERTSVNEIEGIEMRSVTETEGIQARTVTQVLGENQVEKGLILRREDQTAVAAVSRLLSFLLQS